jgi:hypothetical protein
MSESNQNQTQNIQNPNQNKVPAVAYYEDENGNEVQVFAPSIFAFFCNPDNND